jgi:hypothetical protein
LAVATTTPCKGDVALPEPHSTAPAVPSKPAKPSTDFPLTAPSSGLWCKKSRGKLYYFGPLTDSDATLEKYEAQKEALHAGRTPTA